MSAIEKLKALDGLVLAEPWEVVDHPVHKNRLFIVTSEPHDIITKLYKCDVDFATWAVTVHNALPKIVAVLEAARHEQGCHVFTYTSTAGSTCTCGLDKAKAALEAKLDA